jgi:hypothetical protein
MRTKLLLGALIAAVPVLAVAGYAAAGGGQSSLADLRQATTKYHDIAVARAEPNAVELPQVPPFGTGTCIENLNGDGAMGIHLLLQDRVDDKLVPTEPEALLYEKRNDGSYKLTGVEYIVASAERPTLYGQEFDETNLARYGNPGATVWTLHVWVWKPNPDPGRGIFAPWNTRVTCN